ncbi:MAG: 50S ribosomal protein L9 [Chloroflexota bacterium]
MRVILLQDVSGLGKAGEVREVADGYGRNFLIPRKLAQFASPGLLRHMEEKHGAEVRRQQAAHAELAQLAERLGAMEVNVKARVGMQGRLYGAVTSSDIAKRIEELTGQAIDKRKIELEEPIHQPGQYELAVRLSQELVPTVKVVVEGETA